MLSVEECRRILGTPQLSDEEVAEIRDSLVAFSRLFIDDYLRTHAEGSTRAKR